MSLGERLTPTPNNLNGELERRLSAIERRLGELPSRWAGGSATQIYTLDIIGGNTLDDGVTAGIVYSETPIADVPSLYDPDVTSSFIDGIGRARLYIDGISQPGYVLVVHDGGSGAITNALFAGDLCLASPSTVSIPLASDPTQSVTAYRPLTP